MIILHKDIGSYQPVIRFCRVSSLLLMPQLETYDDCKLASRNENKQNFRYSQHDTQSIRKVASRRKHILQWYPINTLLRTFCDDASFGCNTPSDGSILWKSGSRKTKICFYTTCTRIKRARTVQCSQQCNLFMFSIGFTTVLRVHVLRRVGGSNVLLV